LSASYPAMSACSAQRAHYAEPAKRKNLDESNHSDAVDGNLTRDAHFPCNVFPW
jgi:hypothetical protein